MFRFAWFVLLGFCIVRGAVAQAPFVDVTEESGLPGEHPSELNGIGGNIGAFDVDHDGRLDLIFTAGQSGGIVLYRNVGVPGEPAFVDETNVRGLSGIKKTTIGVGIGDFDNNGWNDLFLANIGTNELFLNDNGVFVRATMTHLEGWSGFFAGVAVGDLDVDGDLDLVVANYIAYSSWPFHRGGPDLVLLNAGAGRFTDIADESGAKNAGAALSALLTDMDGDGAIDIVVANDFGPLAIPSAGFRNLGLDEEGVLRFSKVIADSDSTSRVYGMGIARIDLDKDGVVDTFFSSIGRNQWLSGEDSVFWGNDMTTQWGAWTEFTADAYRSAWAPVVVDLTGDGYEDLWIRTGQMVSTWFLNNDKVQPDIAWTFGSDGAVKRIELATLGALPEAGRGAVAADVDADGRVDLWAGSAHDGPLRLLLGAGPISTLALTLAHTISAPGAPGARFWLHCGKSVFVRDGASGGAFGSAGPPGRWWLGRPSVCDDGGTLETRWPSGIRTYTPFSAEKTAIVVHEPRWWWIDSDQKSLEQGCVDLMLAPPTTSGEVVGGGAIVQAAFFGAQPVSAVDLGGGQYRATLCPPKGSGPWPVRLWVNGELLAAHPVITGKTAPQPTLATYPKYVRKFSPTTIYVNYPGAENLGLTVSGGIFLLGEKSTANTLVAQIMPFDNATAMTVGVTDNGIDTETKWQLPVYPAVSPERSAMVINSPYVTAWSGNPSPIQITVWPRDAMGNEVGGELFPIGVRVDGVLVAEQSTSPWSSATQVIVPGDKVGVGSAISVSVGNEILAPPVTVQVHDSPEQWIADLSPEHSDMGFGFATCRAGGEDLVTVLFTPRDTLGHQLPMSPIASELELLIAELGTVVTNTSFLQSGSHLEAVFHCPVNAGSWTVELLFAGVQLGVHRTIVATTVPKLDLDPKKCAVSAYEAITPEPITVIRVTPRTPDGDRVGCGLTVALWDPQTKNCLRVPYCGFGDYCLTLDGCCADSHRAEVYVDGTSVEHFLDIPPGPYADFHHSPAEICGQITNLPETDVKELDSVADAIGCDDTENLCDLVIDGKFGDSDWYIPQNSEIMPSEMTNSVPESTLDLARRYAETPSEPRALSSDEGCAAISGFQKQSCLRFALHMVAWVCVVVWGRGLRNRR
ncbi:MAG: VCBS repeat-containing protein [Myxococcales bacterium]|nr:VCBS repeat-containing protein [Myxococcales bacterium]